MRRHESFSFVMTRKSIMLRSALRVALLRSPSNPIEIKQARGCPPLVAKLESAALPALRYRIGWKLCSAGLWDYLTIETGLGPPLQNGG